MYEGYLELGGGEVINSARAAGYANTGSCSMNWLACPPCDGLNDALGHEPYTYEKIADAPWYDDLNESTHRFLGAHGIRMEGISDSTREAAVVEGILDGGTVGQIRRATKRVRVETMLTAIGEDALETGMSWLKSALTPGACGTHATDCGEADMRFFAACPPDPSTITKPSVLYNQPVTNLVPNPSFEAQSAPATVRTNLATNPSMETAGAAVAVWTNLATNPSFETVTAATVEVRRNLIRNPQGPHGAGTEWTATAQWAGAGGTTALSHVTAADGPPGLGTTKYIRRTWTVVPTSAGDIGFTVSPVRSAVTAGQWIAASSWVRLSWNPNTTLPSRVRVRYYDVATGGTALSTVYGPNVTTPAGVWTQIAGAFQVPAGATFVEVTFETNAATTNLPIVGSTLDATAFIVEMPALGAVAPTSYFDGSTVAANDFSYAWTGTADASASQMYGAQITGSVVSSQYGSRLVSGAGWASTGTKSAHQINLATTGERMALVVGGFGNLGGVTPGKTYTVIAKVRLIAPLTSLTIGPRIGLRYSGPTNSTIFSTAAPNVAGVTELRVTGVVAADATGFMVQLDMGGNGEIWWDDLMVVEGTYTGPYFDGATQAKVRRNLVSNPQAAVNLTGWGSFGSATYSVVTSESHSGGQSVRYVTPGTGPGEGGSAYANGMPTPGQVWSGAAWVKAPAGATMFAALRSNTSGAYDTTVPFVGTGAWQRVIVQGHVTNADAPAVPVIMFRTQVTNQALTFYVDDVLIENRATIGGEYFDGSTPLPPYAAAWESTANASPSYLYDSDLTAAWTGTANASTSTLSAPSVAGALFTADRSIAFQSPSWARSGSKSIRITPRVNGYPNGSYAELSLTGLTVGATYTILGYVRLAAALTGSLHAEALRFWVTGSPNPTVVYTAQATNAPGVYEVRGTFIANAATHTVRLMNGADENNGDVWWDDVLVIAGAYAGPYFDGSTAAASGYTYAWSGVANASTSLQQVVGAAGVPASNANTIILSSTIHTSSRGHSIRLIPSGPVSSDTFASPGGDSGALRLGMVAGGTYTAVADLNLAAPQSGILHARARRIILFYRIGAGPTEEIRSEQAPNVVGTHELRLSFVLPDGTTEAWVRLYNGGTVTSGDVWWDDFLLVNGEYVGDYFDGTFPDSPAGDSQIPGRLVHEYAWTGTADASPSTYRTGLVISVPDDAAYEKQLGQLNRYLHTVTCVSGPTVVQKFHRDDTWGYLVEFVLVAGVPWIFSETISLDFPASPPESIQDTPMNLVPYPSAELAVGAVTALTNYSTNPSLELDTANWSAASSSVTPVPVLGRSDVQDTVGGGVAAAGRYSARARFSPTAASAGAGTLRLDNTSANFPVRASGGRMSVNMWAWSRVVTPTAVIASTKVYIIWRAGTTSIGSPVEVGTVPLGGGVVSASGLVVPPTADNAIVRAEAALTSWAAGAVIDLYADAVAITVP